MAETGDTRCGFIAIIGAPNAGKSTLLNNLVGAKVAIVTHKVQTTRTRMLGLIVEGGSQLIFIDTPGIFRPKRRLDRAMVAAAWSGSADADLTVLLIDAARGVDDDVETIIAGLEQAQRPVILALNKVDMLKDRGALLRLAETLHSRLNITETFMISALSGDGVDDMRKRFAELVPPGPWLYPEDQLSNVTERIMAAEITREKVYLRLHQELPYAVGVETESWQDRKDGGVRIEQVIYVERPSQKGIVIGKGGRQLKELGEMARKDMEAAFDRKVHLFLFVKVDERWSESRAHYQAIGLDWVE